MSSGASLQEVPIERFVDVDEARLRCIDFGGSGRPVLLLHGLCGIAGELTETSSWLRSSCRVVAFDRRGHGRSTRHPLNVRQHVFVRDVVAVIESLALHDVVLVGQSMGGRTAMLAAVARPDLIRSLVVVESSPAGKK